MARSKSTSSFAKESLIANVDEWTNFIRNHPDASAFHEIDFLELMQQTSGSEAYVITERRSDDNALLSVMVITVQKERGIKGWLSNRAIVYGGPLWTSESNQHEFLLALDGWVGRHSIYLEIRNFIDFHAYKPIFDEHQYKYLPYVNFIMPIGDRSVETLIQKMNYNRRREIRISLEQGATVTSTEDENDIREGFEILKDLYQNRVKLPLPDFAFFSALSKKNIGKVFVVKHENNVIGASFCVFNRNGIFTWYYCGKRDYHKKIFPTHLAILGAIDFAVNNRLKLLDFMGAGLRDAEYGVRKYKQEFAGELVEFGRFRKVYAPMRYRLGVFAIQMMQKLK